MTAAAAVAVGAPSLALEREAWSSGDRWVAGLDEVGRGALAGPVVAAAVVLREDAACAALAEVVRDSKALTAAVRCALYPRILEAAVAVAIGEAAALEVDGLGIARATELAMLRALARLPREPDRLLVDGYRLRLWPGPQRHLVGGDRRVLSIAAASVVAKVSRDAAMIDLGHRRPGYGFEAHKGYGTRAHLAAIRERGATAEHRLAWAPFRAAARAGEGPVA